MNYVNCLVIGLAITNFYLVNWFDIILALNYRFIQFLCSGQIFFWDKTPANLARLFKTLQIGIFGKHPWCLELIFCRRGPHSACGVRYLGTNFYFSLKMTSKFLLLKVFLVVYNRTRRKWCLLVILSYDFGTKRRFFHQLIFSFFLGFSLFDQTLYNDQILTKFKGIMWLLQFSLFELTAL